MSETIVVQCPSCGAHYQIDPDKVGQTFACAQCQQPFQPQLQSALSPAYSGTIASSSISYATPGQTAKTSGMAIASLVCGILFCVPLSSILAIVFGIIGINQTKDGKTNGRGLAIAGTVLGSLGTLLLLIMIPLQIAILLPSLNRARETANKAKCASNMHQIGLALLMYKNENANASPPDLTTLWKNESLTGSVFVCPSSNDTPAANPAQLTSGGHLSYVYVIPATPTPDSTTVVLYENGGDHSGDGTNILFGDGHVEWENAAKAKALIGTGMK